MEKKEKIVFTTRYNKPIYEGQEYCAVMKDNSIMYEVANSKTPKNPNIIERFLNKVGATRFLDKKGIKNPVIHNKSTFTQKPIIEEVVVVPKTAEELEEEKLSKLSVFTQLDFVQSQDDFDKWLKRNNTKIIEGNRYLIIQDIIKFSFNTNQMPGCCGGYELNTHDGHVEKDGQNLNASRMKILAKYITKNFDTVIRNNRDNFGIVSYVRKPGNVADASGRIGFLHEASELFMKGGTFVNPNTNNEITMYVINDNWCSNEDD